jgi:alpha-L-rhamnosidase
VRAEPFFSYVVHDALALAGRHDLIVQNVRRWSVFLTEGYDTFGECWGWGTPVHGWSSTPARDVVWSVLGIEPDLPGYERVLVAPHLGLLKRVRGAVPTPFGAVTLEAAGGSLVITSPVPIRYRPEKGVELKLPAGRHVLSMEAIDD